MKRLILVFIFLLTTFLSYGQVLNIVSLGNYKVYDKISVDDFIKINELSVKLPEYKIVSFTFEVTKGGFTQDFFSHSSSITENIKKCILRMKDNNGKIIRVYFTDITVQNTKGEKKKPEDLTYRLIL
jgi:hypothetical protein